MNDQKLEMFRGDTPTWQLTVTNKLTGLPFNLTGCTLWMTAKRNLDDLDAAAVFQLTSAGGQIVIVAPATNGIAEITPLTTSTSALTADARLFYDVQIKTTTNRVYTVASGVLYVVRDATIVS